jgi:NAD(P)H-nitrite reductase large subunit
MPGASPSGFAASGVVFEDGSSMYGDLVVLAEERVSRDGLAASAGLRTAAFGGIVISEDFRTSVPGIWAIGDAAAFDGVRLGLLVAAASAAGACATQLLTASAPAALQAAA